MRVIVSRPLTATLGDSNSLELACDFQAYKLDPAGQAGITFGRDKDCLFPEIIVKNGVRHVHMEEDSVVSNWQAVWDRNGPQADYTSDKILIYGGIPDPTYPKHMIPFMLLDILSPLGHSLLKDIEGMKAVGEMFLEEIAAYSVRLPTDKWIYAK
ncbi:MULTISPECIES: type II toxin-antitoxin system YafO family toxin [Pseudomonas syringae group genomosp. 2]|uniref:Uncharacterized protein n=1 Tax=Pseudomonas savastanoi pv. savastanoi NCPPB 3335 TaxID=693985 RepID=A0ABC8BEX1_PSESS|nr:type II toxin-antitoxin system YafO family toxin [Pseudomonas savastanoi]ARD12825.1 hypothetical protein PSA3335_18245 [Pseudomonas savastanoi pv. savastanoi NCPPB 3335]MBA4702835.1 type II toxin-antitoxin system YafO family toxin [Pseudomonas savastanoi pv. savastanoi]